MRSHTLCVALAAMLLALGGWAIAGPGDNKFDDQDPEIQDVKKLDWKSVDLEAADLRTRVTGLVALNDLASIVGRNGIEYFVHTGTYLQAFKSGTATLYVVVQNPLTAAARK